MKVDSSSTKKMEAVGDGSRNRLTMRLTVDHSLLWFSSFFQPLVGYDWNKKEEKQKMNVGRRPCQPFHRECFYVTGTPTYSLVFDQQRESY